MIPLTGAGPDTFMLSIGGGGGIFPTAAAPEFLDKEFIACITLEKRVPAYASFCVM